MNKHFPRILTLLRKERGISQKAAAEELRVTQALLSHYEKGKRECGLDFLVRVADFYSVSSDYLLGRTASTNGTVITAAEMAYPDEKDNTTARSSLMLVLTKKMLNNSIDVLFTILYKTGFPRLTDAVIKYMTLTFYKIFRLVYEANPDNRGEIFHVSPVDNRVASLLTERACKGAEAELLLSAQSLLKENIAQPVTSTVSLERDYKQQSAPLLGLLKNAETAIES